LELGSASHLLAAVTAPNQHPAAEDQALERQRREVALLAVQAQPGKEIAAVTITVLRHTLLEAAAARVRLAEQVQGRSLALVAQDRRLQ
jgi:hypothetical protein